MDLKDLDKPLDLNRPLGFERTAPNAAARALQGLPWGRIGFGGLGLLFASLIAFVIITDDGMGGEPYAIAQIEGRKNDIWNQRRRRNRIDPSHAARR
jgi:hypothetical protein